MAPNPPFVDGEKPSTAKWNSLVGVYDRATTAIDVVSTAAETTIYTKEIGAGHMSSDRMLRLTILGDYLNNTGSSEDPRLRVKFGGTTIWEEAIALITTNANRRAFYAVINIGNISATVQFMAGTLGIGSANVTAGVGSSDDAGGLIASAGTLGIDTAVAQTLAVTAQHDTSSASLSLRRKYALLELG